MPLRHANRRPCRKEVTRQDKQQTLDTGVLVVFFVIIFPMLQKKALATIAIPILIEPAGDKRSDGLTLVPGTWERDRALMWDDD